jgi:hypothetical protein
VPESLCPMLANPAWRCVIPKPAHTGRRQSSHTNSLCVVDSACNLSRLTIAFVPCSPRPAATRVIRYLSLHIPAGRRYFGSFVTLRRAMNSGTCSSTELLLSALLGLNAPLLRLGKCELPLHQRSCDHHGCCSIVAALPRQAFNGLHPLPEACRRCHWRGRI